MEKKKKSLFIVINIVFLIGILSFTSATTYDFIDNSGNVLFNITNNGLGHIIGNFSTGDYLKGFLNWSWIKNAPTSDWLSTYNATYANLLKTNSTTIAYQNITNLPTCSAGQHLKFDGTILSCTADMNWNITGDYLYPERTNISVGIGTVFPTHKLTVVGDTNLSGSLIVENSANFSLDHEVWISDGTSYFRFYDYSGLGFPIIGGYSNVAAVSTMGIADELIILDATEADDEVIFKMSNAAVDDSVYLTFDSSVDTLSFEEASGGYHFDENITVSSGKDICIEGGYCLSTNWTLDTFTVYNATWDNRGLIVNHTLLTFGLYNATWDNRGLIGSNTYNSTYAGLINNASYLSTYNATYDEFAYNHTLHTFNTYNSTWDNRGLINNSWNQSYANGLYAPNTTSGIQHLLNATGIYSTYNASYVPYTGATSNVDLGNNNFTVNGTANFSLDNEFLISDGTNYLKVYDYGGFGVPMLQGYASALGFNSVNVEDKIVILETEFPPSIYFISSDLESFAFIGYDAGNNIFGFTNAGKYLFDNNVEISGAISSATLTITASSDDLDVSGVNTVFINPSAAVVIGGLKGGVVGQVLYIQIVDDDQDVTLEHLEGVGTQDIYMHQGLDETLNSEYGGWVLICDGTNWYDCNHARHV